jgi:NADH:ubiquinone oxidoreductase subunit D
MSVFSSLCEREEILKIFEMFSGQRMMTSYFRIGGLALEPARLGEARQGLHRHLPEPDRRVRKSADQQPDLDGTNQRRRIHDAGRHAGPGDHRPHAARGGVEDRRAQG